MRQGGPGRGAAAAVAVQPVTASAVSAAARLMRICYCLFRLRGRLLRMLDQPVGLQPAAAAAQDPAQRPVAGHDPQQRVAGEDVAEDDYPPDTEAMLASGIDRHCEKHGEGERE